MSALVVQADALRLPLPDASVDLIVTSPPYFALRAYDAGSAQIGSEPTPQQYLEALWVATAEMARVLKPSGSMFVDLGDKYATAFGPNSNSGKTNWSAPGTRYDGSHYSANRSTNGLGIPQKSLMLLPERYRIGCVDRLGLIARAVIVWNKPNGLPESVQDRVRRSHEDWVHLVKQPRYYSAIDEIREPHAGPILASGARNARYGRPGGLLPWQERGEIMPREQALLASGESRDTFQTAQNSLGKLPGSVWSIPSEPLRLPGWLGVDHYAAFPSEWPRRLILGWSPPGICVECGQGRTPVVERRQEPLGKTRSLAAKARRDGIGPQPVNPGFTSRHDEITRSEATILGYACACTPHTTHPGTGGNRRDRDYQAMPGAGPQGTYARKQAGEYQPSGPWREYHLDGWTPPPTRPAIVADVFGGTGTTAMVARALGRIGLSFDLSHAYSRAARYRVFHSGDWQDVIAKTRGRPAKPLPRHDPDQQALL